HGVTKTELRNGVARDQDGNIDSRDHIGKDHHAVLRHLRISNALHPAQHGVEEHDGHADDDAHVDIDLQITGEDNTYPAHLTRHIGEGDEDHTNHRYHPCRLRVIASTDELRHRIPAELAQIGGETHRQQHVTTRPAHQIHTTVVTGERDDTRHGDERGGRHPVSPGGHPVADGMNAFAGDIILDGTAIAV